MDYHLDYADLLICNAQVFNGENTPAIIADVAVIGDKIVAIGKLSVAQCNTLIDAHNLALAPGFIDVHTHDDLALIKRPAMLAKISQGVTTVITGNCGISAVPWQPNSKIVDPINLLGEESEFVYPTLISYISAFENAQPSVNAAVLIGHTTLRAQVMDNLMQGATAAQISKMQRLLELALEQGAIGLSSGLAYASAVHATLDEVKQLASCVTDFDGLYTTHLRTEFDDIIPAMDEAFATAAHASIDLVISHLKCAGKANFSRAHEVLSHLEKQQTVQTVSCDCYPYSASSSTLDLKQVTDDYEIFITWSTPHPEMAQQPLAKIAKQWNLSLHAAAKRLMPAGAVYHCMDEHDVSHFVSSPLTMIGSDGLPCDPYPHPRLWGTFTRVLGHYSRSLQMLPLCLAIHKMTALPASRFKLSKRGQIKPGYYADLVLFDPNTVSDSATYLAPTTPAQGIKKVWVNGILSFEEGNTEAQLLQKKRAGRLLTRQSK